MTPTLSSPDFEDPANRLAHMRAHLRPYWSPMEGGGVFLASPDDAAYEQFLLEFGQLPEVAEAPPERGPVIVAELLSLDARHLFKHAELAPGSYQLDNYHLDHARDGYLDFSADDGPPTKLPIGRRFTFELTADHLKLMRHLNTRDWSGRIEAMDPKRPYGNSSNYYTDMATALGNDQPLEAQRYRELHREMLFAIQAFWQYATGWPTEKARQSEKNTRELRARLKRGDLAGVKDIFAVNPHARDVILHHISAGDVWNPAVRNMNMGFADPILATDDRLMIRNLAHAAILEDNAEIFNRANLACSHLGFPVTLTNWGFKTFASELVEAKDYERAIRLLRVIVASGGSWPVDCNNMARALIAVVEHHCPHDLEELVAEISTRGHADPQIWHYVACIWAKVGETDRAIDAVLCARRDGYDKMDAIATDDLLASLGGNPRFVEALKGNG
jgi:hypothetical protein